MRRTIVRLTIALGQVLRTTHGGRSWTAFDTTDFDAVDCVPGTCWASGPNGAVAVLAQHR